jgi:hypothetical protein
VAWLAAPEGGGWKAREARAAAAQAPAESGHGGSHDFLVWGLGLQTFLEELEGGEASSPWCFSREVGPAREGPRQGALLELAHGGHSLSIYELHLL